MKPSEENIERGLSCYFNQKDRSLKVRDLDNELYMPYKDIKRRMKNEA